MFTLHMLVADLGNADVLGVVTSVGDVSTIRTRKEQKDLAKRDFTLVDQTKREVACTLWGDLANNFEGKIGSSLNFYRCLFYPLFSRFFVNSPSFRRCNRTQKCSSVGVSRCETTHHHSKHSDSYQSTQTNRSCRTAILVFCLSNPFCR